ncbi:extracellular solute-binding protein [Actibacterium atlanticum]|uniref:Putrescine-binding periplasmic protein n=1 Tax=Actibacterium atlanticum TaxID=1461693 RepID=A0A058ZPR2_9RHOB|nr:spermidine/putrescine ABC transporter substrate-binding protein [Actibacterium atlanticum]KCV82811.1 extracellular solute-binding protein [Actibacterium atlanticum]
MRKSRLPISRRNLLQGAAAVGLTLNLPKGARAEGGQVNFYNWDTYIGETTLDDFTGATGIDVQYDLFADNDELFAKMRNGNPGYDLIVPTNDYVERMIQADMLVPLDHSKIPNMKNLDPGFANPAHDPGRKYTMPYMWGTIGIGYRKSAVSKTPDSWADLLTSDEYAGRIATLSEAQTVMQMAMKLMGKSLNDWTDENIAAAEAMIIAQKSRITAFAPDNGQDLLLAGEVDLAMEWNGDILQAMDEDDDIGYVVPKEGGLLWEDDLCIPAGGPNPEGAHALINYILGAEAGAAIADFIYYATPNTAARALLGPEYNENPAIFPSGEAMANSEVSIFPGQDVIAKIDAAWTRVKAAG